MCFGTLKAFTITMKDKSNSYKVIRFHTVKSSICKRDFKSISFFTELEKFFEWKLERDLPPLYHQKESFKKKKKIP